MVCNDTCTHKEFNLSTSSLACKSANCSENRIVLDPTNYACVTDLADLKSSISTNVHIWNETSPKVFEKITLCNYTGCIQSTVCRTSPCTPVCDVSLVAIYSASGMMCNATCTYSEYNLSTQQLQCQSANCTSNRIALDLLNYSCLTDIADLKLYTNTSGYIWYEQPLGNYSIVAQCSYTGCIHDLVCIQVGCSDPFCDDPLFAVYSDLGMVCN